mmetsp:Transcript_17504/g.52273  ORF Transcript_17504/g.52273 Transcript_17504/m.52273 type:complete len:279 (+) Transcript_17504:1578-2414(+)
MVGWCSSAATSSAATSLQLSSLSATSSSSTMLVSTSTLAILCPASRGGIFTMLAPLPLATAPAWMASLAELDAALSGGDCAASWLLRQLSMPSMCTRISLSSSVSLFCFSRDDMTSFSNSLSSRLSSPVMSQLPPVRLAQPPGGNSRSLPTAARRWAMSSASCLSWRASLASANCFSNALRCRADPSANSSANCLSRNACWSSSSATRSRSRRCPDALASLPWAPGLANGPVPSGAWSNSIDSACWAERRRAAAAHRSACDESVSSANCRITHLMASA